MKCEFAEETIQKFHEEERRRRNEALKCRLSMKKSFEDMLIELASLRGLNTKEREAERTREALPA